MNSHSLIIASDNTLYYEHLALLLLEEGAFSVCQSNASRGIWLLINLMQCIRLPALSKGFVVCFFCVQPHSAIANWQERAS